jgi:phosphate transport system protein
MLEKKLVELRKNLAEYAGLIESMLEDSSAGLLQKDPARLRKVIDKYEPRANRKEIALDEQCLALIARHQPMARDLRTILMILNMNRDLERMGDHTVNIAQSALYLSERPHIKPLLDLPRMSGLAQAMLRDSAQAFLREDPALAKKVLAGDDQVDALHIQIFRELITYMSADVSTIERALHIIRISSNLERIADLATNISEEVIFMVEGKVLKHQVKNKE